MSWQIDQPAGQPHEHPLLRLDASLARELLGWQPRLPLEEGLAWLVEWFRAYRAGQDLRKLTRAQIAR